MNKEVFEIFQKEAKFRGIACKDMQEGEFCMLFEVKGTEFLIDEIKIDAKNHPAWSIIDAKIYHYDSQDAHNEEKNCVFCNYEYTGDKVMKTDMVCEDLNKQEYIEAIFGTCIFDGEFEMVWNNLIEQMNPKKIEKMV